VVACLKNGINQFLDRYKDETKAALKDGELTEAEIDRCCGQSSGSRSAGAAGSAGDGAVLEDQGLAGAVEYGRDRDVSKRLALESVVLLKNENNFCRSTRARSSRLR
jgi:beta-glucosidase